MINEHQYVISSIELHLFFLRIMKEHAIFLEAGFCAKDGNLIQAADQFKEQFESLLLETLHLGSNFVTPDVISSGEIITDYTLESEQKTSGVTGIMINQEITMIETHFSGMINQSITDMLIQQVRYLNGRIKLMLDRFIDYKNNVLNSVLSCRIFTTNYPLLLEHIIHEAKTYKNHIIELEVGRNPDDNIKATELFWDDIMLEHALFIRGLLSPGETELIKMANGFVKDYVGLIKEAKTVNDIAISSITDRTLQETIKYRDFKSAGLKGIMECKIRSVILPLLADHVLREANHYIRLLTKCEK